MGLKSLGAIVTTSLSNDCLITESRAQQLIDYHQALAHRYQAKRFVSMGTEHVLCFDRVDQAYAIALALNEGYPDLGITVHLGEVCYSDKDVFGNTVEGAWIMQSFCSPGSILISAAVFNQLPVQTCSVQSIEQDAGIYRLIVNGNSEVNLRAS